MGGKRCVRNSRLSPGGLRKAVRNIAHRKLTSPLPARVTGQQYPPIVLLFSYSATNGIQFWDQEIKLFPKGMRTSLNPWVFFFFLLSHLYVKKVTQCVRIRYLLQVGIYLSPQTFILYIDGRKSTMFCIKLVLCFLLEKLHMVLRS